MTQAFSWKRLRSQRGFTLLEILVVMTILAMVMAVAAPAIKKPSPQSALQNIARELTANLRATRALALADAKSLDFLLDLNRKSYWTPNGQETVLPPALAMAVKTAALHKTESLEDDAGQNRKFNIRFYPDGSSSGGEIALSLESASIQVKINWLTGVAGIAP